MSIFEAVTDGNNGPLLEQGRYILELEGVEPAGEGKYGPSVKWTWLVREQADPTRYVPGRDGGAYRFYQWTSTKLTPKARARDLVEALLGGQLNAGEEINPLVLTGRCIDALVAHVTGEDGKVRARIVPGAKPYSGKRLVAAGVAAPANRTGSTDDEDLEDLPF